MGTTFGAPSTAADTGGRYREAPSRAFTPLTRTVTTTPVAVGAANPDRRTLLLVNTAATGGPSVFLTNDRNSHPDSSYELAPGEGLTLTTAAAVYAYTTAGSAAVKVIDETGCA